MFKPTLGAADSLDRASHRRSDAKWLEELKKSTGARYMVLCDQKPVITSNADRSDTRLRWLTNGELARLELPATDAFFLGVEHGTGDGRFVLAITDHRARMAPGAVELLRPVVDLRSLAMHGSMKPEELSLVGQAKALAAWHENTRCCGHCGGTTSVKDGGWKRKCWACGTEHFPRTDPVVIMLIVDRKGERCLLGHESRFMEKMWSTLAGFIEPGEDIEHAVRRETLEEVGLKVGEVRFHSTQPWPFPHSLMIGCIGYAETTEITIDPNEISDARWYPKAEVKQMLDGHHPDGLWVPGQQAIAHSLIKSFVDGEI